MVEARIKPSTFRPVVERFSNQAILPTMFNMSPNTLLKLLTFHLASF
jgi:hypothetical protein